MSTSPVIRAIVGLGNPGSSYARTRHNAGFWFVDRLLDAHRAELRKETRFQGLAGEVTIAGARLLLLKPTTFMNKSGGAVQALMAFHKLHPSQLLIAHDELDLPAGTARLKAGGGHGGHNGLRDLHATVGSEYRRLRLGIGHPGHKDLVHDYVLHKPGAEDEKLIRESIDLAVDALPVLIEKGWEHAMNKLHPGKAVAAAPSEVKE